MLVCTLLKESIMMLRAMYFSIVSMVGLKSWKVAFSTILEVGEELTVNGSVKSLLLPKKQTKMLLSQIDIICPVVGTKL